MRLLGLRLIVTGALVLGLEKPAPASTPSFVDIADAAGLTVITYSGGVDKNHILESTGNGVLALDYDLDGDQDLYFVNAFRLDELGRAPEYTSVLYRNDGHDTFVDVSVTAGVAAAVYGHGGCVGDFDGDGLPDIYVTVFGPNLLYRNNGDGTFQNVTVEAGVGDPGWGIGATFFDADGDGDQDLFVGNYIDASWEEILAARRTRRWRGRVDVMDGPRGLPEARNVFFRNRGDGTFENATESSGLAAGGDGYSMGVATFDYDRDGSIDLYVANDSTPNRLYRNAGDGSFEEVGMWTGSAYNADGRMQGSMGAGFGDYDGDGWQDLIVTNFAHDYYVLYRNLNGDSFQDDSFIRRLAAPSFRPLGWAAVLFDVDNDRDVDLFFSNGHIYPQVDEDPTLYESYRQRNQLLVNEDGDFRDVSVEAGSGFEIEQSSRGASVVDFDNDGDLDIAISNQDARPTLLKNLLEGSNHWIAFDLCARPGNPQVLGSTVEVMAAGTTQVRQSSSGGSYASQNDLRLHVGLADS
ncbi:MAG: CRTAC1 family protein, partial [Acidobacteriota bacterium]|nr:CRTAC1 family protein [Acidobacteriota bacterium]